MGKPRHPRTTTPSANAVLRLRSRPPVGVIPELMRPIVTLGHSSRAVLEGVGLLGEMIMPHCGLCQRNAVSTDFILTVTVVSKV
jgi:hypothetical protein